MAPQNPPSPTPLGEAWIDTGILWHRIRPNTVITEDQARASIADMANLVGDTHLPAIVDIRGVEFADKEARDVFANEVPFEVATAIIVDSVVSKGLGNIYLKVSRPSRPTRLFTSETAAEEWAQRHTGRG
jgi:hypothetical protein